MPLPQKDESYEVTCPHCRKSFAAPVLVGTAERYTGFKCPHCRLFVSYERVGEQATVERAE